MQKLPGIQPDTKAPPLAISSGQVEILVSAALVADGPIELLRQSINQILPVLQKRYEFFEILVVTHATFYSQNEAAFAQLLGQRNIRCLILRDGVGEYRARVIATAETIGDVVLILSAQECPSLDLHAILEKAETTGGSVILRRRRRAGVLARLSGRLLSTISGYHVDPQIMRSGAHHRAWLNRIVNRADGEVALRFMPHAARHGTDVTEITVDKAEKRLSRPKIGRRLLLASEVLMYAPPHLLRVLAGVSILVMVGSVLFFVYAIILFAAGIDLEPGWLTISLAISGSTAFISLALGALSTALYQILSSFRDQVSDEIQNELDNNDLFREFRRVNVETVDPG